MRTTRNCRIAHALTLAFMASFAVACSDGEEVVGLDSSEYELLIVSGNNQNGLAGTVMEEPLVVQVRRIDTGAPLPGATVKWSVLRGGGEPTRATSTTDENGWATTRVVLGRTFNDGSAIDVDVAAVTQGLKRVIFDIAVTELPVLRSVSPTSADPGDIVEIGLSNLHFGYPVQILFDGIAGAIVSRQNGAQGLISAVVPQPAGVCSDAVQSVEVRARVGGLTTRSLNLNVSVPEDPFQIGQVLIIESDEDVDCVLLPADGGGARYLVVALSAEFEADGLFEVRLSSGNVVVAGANQTAPQGRSDFHGWLRDLEGELAGRGLSKVQPAFSGQLFLKIPPYSIKHLKFIGRWWYLTGFCFIEDLLDQI